MTYKEIKQLLKSTIEPFFISYGFKGRVSSDGIRFEKKTELGANSIVFGVSDYNPLYKTGFTIFIGSLSCYRVFHYISKTEVKYIKTPSTIAFGYTDYLNVVNYDFEVIEKEDVSKVFTACTHFMETAGFPFFEKYTTLESLDELLNADPYSKVIYKSDTLYRAVDGLIIAKLLGNPRYDYLLSSYTDRMKQSPPHFRIFERYTKFLQEHTREELLEIAATVPK